MSQTPDQQVLRCNLHRGADERDPLSAQVDAQIPVSQGQKAIKKSRADLWHYNLRSRIHRGDPSSWAGLSRPAGRALAGGAPLVAAAPAKARARPPPHPRLETEARTPR